MLKENSNCQDCYDEGYIQGRQDAAQDLLEKMTEFAMLNGYAEHLINVVKNSSL